MNEKELDELLKEEAIDKDFQKKLKRKMNKNIYSKAITVILVFCLCMTSLYYLESYISTKNNYNPLNEEEFLHKDYSNQIDEFGVLFCTYLNLLYPGYYSYPVQKTESFGFGKYELGFQTRNIFSSDHLSNAPNRFIGIDKGDFSYRQTTSEIFWNDHNQFLYPNNPYFTTPYTLAEIKELVHELPDSSILDASLTFKKSLTMDEVAKFMNEYDDVTFVWISLLNQSLREVPGNTLGINFDFGLNYQLFQLNQKYPYFCVYESEEENGEKLQQSYLSKLELLLDHPDFVEFINIYTGENMYESLTKLYESAQKELLSNGFRVHLTKKQLIYFMDNFELSHVTINNEKSSIFAK